MQHNVYVLWTAILILPYMMEFEYNKRCIKFLLKA
jgi:hypothetical protein